MEVPDSALVDRTVLVIWHSGSSPEVLQPLVNRLRTRVGEKGRVMLENVDRLESCESEKEFQLSSCYLYYSPFSFPLLTLSLLLLPFSLSLSHPVPQQESSLDVILSGFLPPPSLSHSSSVLAELARLLKPSGALFLLEPVATAGEK